MKDEMKLVLEEQESDSENSRTSEKQVRAAWLSENAKAIAAYNQHVAEFGVFSDHVRMF
ncbi:hypothetical protein Pres01_03150 [Metapseudomonas resinovorans]|uniref:type II toxin-antitoxin system CcdA family antitoxin n=1 Tax=Metapseudomonas resinovorans TaxID=53412 RepID=UPI000984A85F|nr:type II toxin-antitoxin system CcdA family antitoxin [Pseudomonas resinovorans]GLZ84264.1 hypothetical protein Pres01_03150 [Pseudomonas resinovorans]